jgi:hypothetical protein
MASDPDKDGFLVGLEIVDGRLWMGDRGCGIAILFGFIAVLEGE